MEAFKSFEHLLQTVNENSFERIALEIFKFQAKHNPLYKEYLSHLHVNAHEVSTISEIPFVPIQFFKSHQVKTGTFIPHKLYRSSGTTHHTESKHWIWSEGFYHQHALRLFQDEFGEIGQFVILALLPSYLEKGDSSLVSMVRYFIDKTNHPKSGFYLHNYEQLVKDAEELKKGKNKIIVWGVTYALLEIAEQFSPNWSGCFVFETGGMKGRRKEMIREELHAILKEKLNVQSIYSEYGMTELLSQAYCKDGVWFRPSATLKVVIREIGDPRKVGLINQNGGINVIDLANFATLSFIETEDIGKCDELGHFQVLGRMDNSDVRGCNLLVQ